MCPCGHNSTTWEHPLEFFPYQPPLGQRQFLPKQRYYQVGVFTTFPESESYAVAELKSTDGKESYEGVPVLQESSSGDITEFLTCLASSVLKERPEAINIAGTFQAPSS